MFALNESVLYEEYVTNTIHTIEELVDTGVPIAI
jgi:hypothetical protein